MRKVSAKSEWSTDIDVEELRLRVVAFIDDLLHAFENMHRGSSRSHKVWFGVSARGRALRVIVQGQRRTLRMTRGGSNNKAVNVDWKGDTGYITYI